MYNTQIALFSGVAPITSDKEVRKLITAFVDGVNKAEMSGARLAIWMNTAFAALNKES
jgi:hypothetical protein